MRIPQRLQLIKFTVLLGLFVSVLLSYNLWAGQRWFPKVPFFDGYMGIPAPYDYFNLAILLLLIVLSFVSPSKLFLYLLVLFSVYLVIDDQNRIQPWFYNYVLMIVVLLFYKQRVDEPNNYTSVFISLQLLVALVYVFSGLQKFNSFFVTDTYSWIISPLQNQLSERKIELLMRLGKTVPYIEIALGIGLLIRQTRYITLPLIVIMHIIILLLLGPFGSSYNSVVWPWNITMIVLNLVLFANVERERFFDIAFLFKGSAFYIVVTLMFIFPFFSFQNKYDSYLSSSLYSGNTSNCTIILSDNAYKKLPYYIQNFVTTSNDEKKINVKRWCMTELNAPCVPEYRIFNYVRYYLVALTGTTPNDVKMEFLEREKLFGF